MDEFFKDMFIIKKIERAYDLGVLGYTKKPTRSKKRSRETWEGETDDELFKSIYDEMVYEDVFPTLRSLVLEKFHVLVATQEENEYYQQMINIIIDFRFKMKTAEQLYCRRQMQDFYFYMLDEVIPMLRMCKHPILLFHLSI